MRLADSGNPVDSAGSHVGPSTASAGSSGGGGWSSNSGTHAAGMVSLAPPGIPADADGWRADSEDVLDVERGWRSAIARVLHSSSKPSNSSTSRHEQLGAAASADRGSNISGRSSSTTSVTDAQSNRANRSHTDQGLTTGAVGLVGGGRTGALALAGGQAPAANTGMGGGTTAANTGVTGDVMVSGSGCGA